MNVWMITLLLFLAASIQTMLPRIAILGSYEWPCLSCTLLFIALRTRPAQLVFATVLSGLLYESLSPLPLGAGILYFSLLAGVVYRVRDEVFNDQIVTYVFLGLLSGLLKTTCFFVLLNLGNLRDVSALSWGIRLANDLFLSLIAAPSVFLCLSAGQRILFPKRRWIGA
jgi:cell shape-determining protein MreD